MYILVWVLLKKIIWKKKFLFCFAHVEHRLFIQVGGSGPSLVGTDFFSSCPLSCLSTRFSRASFIPRLPLGSGCTFILDVRLFGSQWSDLYVYMYMVLYRYMGICWLLVHQYVFLFDPLSFFLFGTQFPGLYVASSQRFLPRVFSSRWVWPPLIAGFGVRRYSMRYGDLRGAGRLLLKWGSVSSLHQLMLIPLVGPSQGLLLPLVPFWIGPHSGVAAWGGASGGPV